MTVTFRCRGLGLASAPARHLGCYLALAAVTSACGAPSAASSSPHAVKQQSAPVVPLAPGAWFDADGNLLVVGPRHRLRLALSAPVIACDAGAAAVSDASAAAADEAARASVPFHVLSEACRDTHPSILLATEADTASPSELERSYHEVAACATVDYGGSEGWVPDLVEHGDPCRAALGLGWRLPSVTELNGLTLDDRKAIAGALFDTAERSDFGSLLLYAQGPDRGLTLVTLSPNAAERAPELTDEQRSRALLGPALRCVPESGTPPETRAEPPPLPHALECLQQQRDNQGLRPTPAPDKAVPELDRLKAWVTLVQGTPGALTAASLNDLTTLLSTPALEQLARDAREERALTERYSELAEGLDDPSASPGERARRRSEFDQLRKRLSGEIVRTAEASGSRRTELFAVLMHLEQLLTRRAATKPKSQHAKKLDLAPVLARVRELRSGKAGAP